jgi:hypothetical protein
MGLGVLLGQKADLDIMHMCNTNSDEGVTINNGKKNYSRNMKPEELDEIETQGGRLFNGDNEAGDFHFDLKPVI